MSAIGWAVLPITPSLRGLGAELNKELMAPARKAARAASADIEGQMAAAAKRAAADVKRSRDVEVKATEAVVAAESKLQSARAASERNARSVESSELKLKATRERAARDVAAAEDALQRARSTGDVDAVAAAESKLSEVRARSGSTVLDRELALSRARERASESAGKIESAEKGVARAKDGAAEASENVIGATRRLDRAQSMTREEFGRGRDELNRFNSQLEATAEEMGRTGDQSSGLGDKIRAGLATMGTGALLGTGAAMGSAVTQGFGTALSAGFDRLKAVDQARASLSGLGHDAQSVETIMTNAMNSVKGTAFGFGDAASLAGTLVASGIAPGQELERVLKLVGDASAITGTDLGDMGSIWAKVAANGKLSAEEMNQMLDRGVGLLPALAKHLGVSNEEARKLISEGKVSFAEFSTVMEGMTGGAALKMGDTFSGAFDNMKAALGRFGATLLGPIFDNAPVIFAELTTVVDDLGKRVEPAVAAFAERMAPVLKDLAANVAPAVSAAIRLIGEAFGTAVGAVRDFAGWVERNQTWLIPLGGAVGVLAGAFALLSLQMKVAAMWQGVMAAGGLLPWIMRAVKGTQAWTAAQAALNIVAKANPIFLIITGLVALGAALYLFFTKTETGRAVWASMVEAFTTGWEWIKGAFATAWAFIQPVMSKLGAFFTKVGGIVANIFGWMIDNWQLVVSVLFGPLGIIISQAITHWDKLKVALVATWDVIKGVFAVAWSVIQGIFTAMKIAFAVVLTAALLLWEGIKLYWTLIANIVVWAWDTLIKPAWDAMRWGLEVLGAAFGWAWNSVIKPAWDALGIGIKWVWDALVMPAFEAIKFGLGLLGAAFGWAWNNVIKPAWDALGVGIRWVSDFVVRPVFDAIKIALGALGTAFSWAWNNVIKPVWDALGTGIRWVLDSVVHPAFDGLKTGLRLIQEGFAAAVDFIGKMWDGIRGVVARPIKFVIDQVYNAGIVPLWNKVAGWVGLDPIDEWRPGWLGDYASGGVLPGYTPGRDVYRFVDPKSGMHIGLGGGEAIMRPEFTRAVGGPAGVDRLNKLAKSGKHLGGDGNLGGYRSGGVVGDLGGFAGGGVVESIVALVNEYFPGMSISSTYRNSNDHHGSGLAVDFSNGTDTTPQMQAAARFFYENYGPGLLELIHWPLNGWQNIDNGVPFDFGPVTNSQHRNHVHVAAPAPLGPPGSPIAPLASGGGGGLLSSARALLGAAFSEIVDPIMGRIPEGEGAFGKLPKAFAEKLVGGVRDFLTGRAGVAGSTNYTPGSGPVVDQVREAFAAHGWDKEPYWSAVDFIVSHESSWNPAAVNPSSGAFGLFQFLGATKDAYLPDSNPNPGIQAQAGARYIRDRYGNPLAARDFWVANNWYDEGGALPPGLTLAMNGTGETEAILTGWQWRDIGKLVEALFDLTPEMQKFVDDGLVALEDFANRAGKAADERRPEWDKFVAGIGPNIASSVGDSVAEFFGFDGVVSRMVEIHGAFNPATAPSVVAADTAVATVEPATTDPAKAAADASDKEAKGAVPAISIGAVYANNDEDVVAAGLREVRRAARSTGLFGGWL